MHDPVASLKESENFFFKAIDKKENENSAISSISSKTVKISDESDDENSS